MTSGHFETEAARLETIEIKLAHLERLLQELGQTVMRQQRDIEVLALRHRELKCQLESIDEGGADAAGFEKPPHY
ncbi:MAG TPA: SlyX family protein [Steroidobacteraceae bacterium]